MGKVGVSFEMVKQVIAIRKDLNMRKGKMIAQGAHASMKIFFDIAQYIQSETQGNFMIAKIDDAMGEWLLGKFTKIVVSVDSESELCKIYNDARAAGLHCSIIKDVGATEFHGNPTFTAIAVGPNEAEEIDKITGHLKLL